MPDPLFAGHVTFAFIIMGRRGRGADSDHATKLVEEVKPFDANLSSSQIKLSISFSPLLQRHHILPKPLLIVIADRLV